MNTKVVTTVLALAMGILATGASMTPSPADAAPYWPWCSRHSIPALPSCAFATKEQCLETVSGLGGYCYINHRTDPYTRQLGAPAKLRRQTAS
jgi:Protein of unknown function (DUF3551)